MSRSDDFLGAVRKTVGDAPLYLIAGVGDLVSEKLRELPEAITTWQEENRDFPLKAAGAMVGSAFRANLKVGEIYDDLTRRGKDVVTKMRGEEVFAEEDEPFIREPFTPQPVHAPPAATRDADVWGASTRGAGAKKTTAKRAVGKVVKKSPGTKAATQAATKTTAKTAAKKATAKKATAKKTTPRNAAE